MAAISAFNIATTNRPIQDASGLVSGYQNDRRYSTDIPNDYPVWSNGKLVSNSTGKAWSGDHPTLGPGNTAQNGMIIPKPATPPALPEFTVTKTVKQPEYASAISGALQTQQAQQADLNKSFTELLAQSKAELAAQNTKSQAAFDTTGTDKELREINRSYEADAGTNLDEIRARNAAYADESRRYVDTVQANTADTAARLAAVRDQAYAQGVKRSNLSLLQSGTQAGSGANTNRLNRAYLDAALPYELQVGQIRRADLTDVLRPTQQQNFQNDQNYFSLKSNLDDKFRGNRSATAQYLQSIKATAAQMSSAQLSSYLNDVARVLGLGQQLQSGAITNLGLLQRLDALANEYTFNTPYQDRTPATPFYTPAAPRRNYVSDEVYPPQGNGGGGQRSYSDNAPLPTRPDTTFRGYAPTPQMQARGDFRPILGYANPGGDPGRRYGTDTNTTFNAETGQLENTTDRNSRYYLPTYQDQMYQDMGLYDY